MAIDYSQSTFKKGTTKLDRAIAGKAARLLDASKLRQWAKDVKDRDLWKDRKTGKRVRSTRRLDPDRAESHHIEPKENRATRYDVRNGVRETDVSGDSDQGAGPSPDGDPA